MHIIMIYYIYIRYKNVCVVMIIITYIVISIRCDKCVNLLIIIGKQERRGRTKRRQSSYQSYFAHLLVQKLFVIQKIHT
jgi:hypothetical protein